MFKYVILFLILAQRKPGKFEVFSYWQRQRECFVVKQGNIIMLFDWIQEITCVLELSIDWSMNHMKMVYFMYLHIWNLAETTIAGLMVDYYDTDSTSFLKQVRS